MVFDLKHVKYGTNGGRLETVDLLPFKSIVWEDAGFETGKLQAVFALDDITRTLLKVGSFARIPNTASIMYIHSVKHTNKEIWAYGYDAKALLQKIGMRADDPKINTSVNVATAINSAITAFPPQSFFSSSVDGVDAMRQADLSGLEAWNLYDYMTKALSLIDCNLTTGEVGGRINLRSRRTRDVSDVVRFSPPLGNLDDFEYSIDDQGYFSKVIAIGKNRSGAEVIGEYSDANPPRETTTYYLDLRDEFPQPDDMTDAAYANAIVQRAKMSKIARYERHKLSIKNVDATDYNSAYTLGDRVGVIIPGAGVEATMRVAKVTYTLEGMHQRISLTLDKPILI